MIRGNHDYWWESAGKLNRMDAENKIQYLYGSTAVPAGDKEIAICGTHGWVCPGDIHCRLGRQAVPAGTPAHRTDPAGSGSFTVPA